MRIPGLAEGVYCLPGSGVDFERRLRGLRDDEREGLGLWPRVWPLSDTDERTEPAEVQRLREPALRDCEDSIEDTRERGGESPLVEDGAETDFDQGVKRGLMNFEEKDFLDVGRDWRDVEEMDGLRLTTAGRGGGGI
jgi:hypothetical protein